MFELDHVTVKCTATSKNTENLGGGGGKTRMGVSMFFEWNTKNEALDMLNEKLRPSFYERAANDAQEDLTGHLPSPKFPQEKPFPWPYVGQGFTFHAHKELSFSKDYEIGDCKIEDFSILFKADGVVTIKWRTYCYPTEADSGSLLAMEKHDVVISLIAPASDYVAPAPIKKQKKGDKKNKEAPAANESQGELIVDEVFEALYTKGVAEMRTTKNPNSQALMMALHCTVNDAARIIMRAEQEGVIKLEDECYVVVEAEKKEEAA